MQIYVHIVVKNLNPILNNQNFHINTHLLNSFLDRIISIVEIIDRTLEINIGPNVNIDIIAAARVKPHNFFLIDRIPPSIDIIESANNIVIHICKNDFIVLKSSPVLEKYNSINESGNKAVLIAVRIARKPDRINKIPAING